MLQEFCSRREVPGTCTSAHRFGGRLRRRGDRLSLDALPPEPFERSEPELLGRVQQCDVRAVLLLERAPALLIFFSGHRVLLVEAYESGRPAVESGRAIREPPAALGARNGRFGRVRSGGERKTDGRDANRMIRNGIETVRNTFRMIRFA